MKERDLIQIVKIGENPDGVQDPFRSPHYDNTVGRILVPPEIGFSMLIGVTNNLRKPYFSTSVIKEIHQNDDNQYTIKTLNTVYKVTVLESGTSEVA